MKVLVCHNFYQQPGGEDQSFAAEARLLESAGHEVLRFTRHNDDIDGMSRLAVARKTIWNRETYRELRALLLRERPDVMHCTNTFPLISPAAYYAARAEGTPVVQSLRNYRLMCPGAYFLRDGQVCEDCLGKMLAWPAIVHGCYRGSRAGSAVVASLSAAHRLVRTWSRTVDQYFTLTEFARTKFVAAGIPLERIAVKPNFIDPDPGLGMGTGGYAIYVGRLSPEKGIATLLNAWRQLSREIPLRIVGDGPLADEVRAAAARDPRIEYLGHRPTNEVLELIGEASLLVMPSLWYETFGRTIIEAFAKGTPVVASRLGAMAELVREGETGRLFTSGDARDLAAQVESLLADTERLPEMREAARREYLRGYTAAPNLQMLLEIYELAIERRAKAMGGGQHQRLVDRSTHFGSRAAGGADGVASLVKVEALESRR